MDVDFKVTQLLVSRICHDLAGGISALSTGSELLLEENETPDSETLNLIALSAEQTAHRLQFLRVAFGSGGGEDGTITTHALQKLTSDYLAGGRVSLVWSEENARIDVIGGKLLLNLCLIAAESLPRGGVVEVDVQTMEAGLGFAVAAIGDGACVPEQLRGAIGTDIDVESLTSRTVHGHFCAALAAHLGAELEIAPTAAGSAKLAALIPSM